MREGREEESWEAYERGRERPLDWIDLGRQKCGSMGPETAPYGQEKVWTMSWHAWMGMSVTMGLGIRLGMMSLEIAPQSKHRRNERLGEKCRN